MMEVTPPAAGAADVTVAAGAVLLPATLWRPTAARGLVLFAHGSGSSRHSPRNRYVAQVLAERHVGSLLLDLLTPDEDAVHARRFDIPLLTRRLRAATDWVRQQPALAGLPLGYFGASTGAAAALMAAAEEGAGIRAVVCRGGRPDLASADALRRVRVPTLLLVGGRDEDVLALNHQAAARMATPPALVVVPGATHLFEEPGALEAVAAQAADWLGRWLVVPPSA